MFFDVPINNHPSDDRDCQTWSQKDHKATRYSCQTWVLNIDLRLVDIKINQQRINQCLYQDHQ